MSSLLKREKRLTNLMLFLSLYNDIQITYTQNRAKLFTAAKENLAVDDDWIHAQVGMHF